MFKKPSKTKNVRKRTLASEDDDEHDEEQEETVASGPAKVQRKADGKLKFSSGSGKRTQGDSEDGDSKPLHEDLARPVRFTYESTRQVQMQNDSRATATLETETEFDRDARAIREKVLKRAEEALKGGKQSDSQPGDSKAGDSKSKDEVYQGMAGYVDHTAGFRRELTVASEKGGGAHGPLRASAHIRWSVRFDYQPDLCKDYKETGYCGYGDSCKFLHDRGDYKAGWQIDREWEEKEKKKKQLQAMGLKEDGEEEEEESDDDELPFACFICRQPFVDPVVTKCKHYFCEHCALKVRKTALFRG